MFTQKNCTWTFKAALFMIASKWKQPKYPSLEKWVTKCDIATQENSIQPLKRISTDMLNMAEPWKHYAKGEKPGTKGHMHGSTYMKCLEEANP